MSAIGDYIHATSLGYCRHGENRTPFYDAAAITSMIDKRTSDLESWNQRQNINSSLKKQLEKEFEQNLYLLRGLQSNSEISLTQEEQENAELLAQSIFEEVEEYLDKVDIETVQATNILQGNTGFKAGQDVYYNSDEWEKKVLNLISQLIQNIDNELSSVVKENHTTLATLQQKTQSLQIAKNELFQALQEVNFTQGRGRKLKQKVNRYFSEVRQYMWGNKAWNKNDYKKINSLIQAFVDAVRKHNWENAYTGKVGEVLSKIVSAQALAGAEGVSINQIHQEIVGANASKRGIGNLSKEFVDLETLKQGKKYSIIEDKNLLITANSAMEKIDIEVYIKGQKRNGLFGSVKNYNTESLHAVPFASRNVGSLLDNENKDNLVNHFLNLVTINTEGFNTQNEWNRNKKEVNQYIRKLLLQKLISGQGTSVYSNNGQSKNMKAANVFIAINSDNFTVKIYNIGQMLNQLQHLSKYVNFESLLPEWSVIKDPKNTYPDARTRITDILIPLVHTPSVVNIDFDDIKTN